jgi:RND family efflux transporter MFP subunit
MTLTNFQSGVCFATALALLLSGCGHEGTGAAAPVEVNVVTATPAAVPVPVEFPAVTEAVRSVEIRAQVSGIVRRQAFTEGAQIRKGDLLFEIDPQPHEVALMQARATLAQAEASRINAQQNYERARPLAEQDAISQQELEAAEAAARGTEASVEAARAAMRQAELNLEYTQIRSPFDGFIGEAAIKIGGLVSANQTLLATVSSIDPVYATFNISERGYLNWVAEHPDESIRTATATRELPYTMTLSNGQTYPHPGVFNFVDRTVDAQTGTLRVRIEFPNREQVLRPGQFVRIHFPFRTVEDAIVIPQRAVLTTQDLKYVFVVTPAGKLESRDVVMGERLKVGWIVRAGLKAGDKVVVDGMQKVHPGDLVRPVELPAASTNAALSTKEAR